MLDLVILTLLPWSVYLHLVFLGQEDLEKIFFACFLFIVQAEWLPLLLGLVLAAVPYLFRGKA
jgi:hypothetical protein